MIEILASVVAPILVPVIAGIFNLAAAKIAAAPSGISLGESGGEGQAAPGKRIPPFVFACVGILLMAGAAFSAVSVWNVYHTYQSLPDETTFYADGTTFYGNHRYLLVDDSCDWSEAKIRCEKLGGHLATITTEGELKFVNSLIKSGGKEYYWLGGSDDGHEDVWTWVTGELWNKTIAKWRANQPDNYGNNENFLQVKQEDGSWNDIGDTGYQWRYEGESGTRPSTNVGYICEWE